MYNLKAVSIVLGKPLVDKVAVKLSEKQLKKWVGAYQFEDVIRFITYDNGVLYGMREGGCHPLELLPLGENEFKFHASNITYNFGLKNGKKQVLYADRIEKIWALKQIKSCHQKGLPLLCLRKRLKNLWEFRNRSSLFKLK